MSRLLCCVRPTSPPAPPLRLGDMGAALSHPQDGSACDGAAVVTEPPTMADVIRERKKKAGGAGLGTLRRRIAAAARRPRDARPDRGCEHARFIRSVVCRWRLAEVAALCEELEAGAALRDLCTQAELAREPAAQLHHDLATAYSDRRWCDVELVGAGFSIPAHRAILAARCSYFRDLFARYPSNTVQVGLDGVCSGLSRAELELVLSVLYAGAEGCADRLGRRHHCRTTRHKWVEGGMGSENDLDIISGDNTGTHRSTSSLCSCSIRRDTNLVRTLSPTLGFSVDTLGRDMKCLLESGEYADAALVFRGEGSGACYGFRQHTELPCHRVVLAHRSRFFRSVMLRRRTNSGSNPSNSALADGAVCVDESVLPRRFARALLHAAYTDQVDLSLIGRNTSPPSSANSSTSSNMGWASVGRSASAGSGNSLGRQNSSNALSDACQLYEIARFVEMPIVVQGCEDAIVRALSPDSLPHILRWCAHAHASQWVMRQAMRYLRDEFPTIMSSASSALLPRPALGEALSSPFLQASEPQALRALLRWAERAAQLQQASNEQPREPNVVWHTAHSRRGARRREVSDSLLRETLATLAPLVRVEHIPHDHDLKLQAIRRGIIPQPPPQLAEEGCAADAWLGRGSYRPPRCFLPYLDELKALLEHQSVPEAEVARVRRTRYLHRIPDTLYMVAEARSGATAESAAPVAPASGSAESACISPRRLAQLRGRVRELRASPPAARALLLPAIDTNAVYRQIALRAVREMSLPDSCAELLLSEMDTYSDRSRGSSENLTPPPSRADSARGHNWPGDLAACCRTLSSSGSLRCASSSSRTTQPSLHIPIDGVRSNTSSAGLCRRELPSTRPIDLHSRTSVSECRSPGARLSACVPDVAMAPNANTHLLTNRDYFPNPPPEYGGGVLQLDLGDGATHTPRPGSRAQRAHQNAERTHRTSHQLALMGCARPRPDDDDLRQALELSVMRAYSCIPPANANPALAASSLARRPLPHSTFAAHTSQSAQNALSVHSSTISGHSSTISGHSSTISGHSSTISGHNSAISVHNVHNNALSVPNTALSIHNSAITGHNTLNGHSNPLNIHSNTLSGHSSSRTGHNNALTGHNSPLSIHNSALSIHNSALSVHNSQTGHNTQNNTQKLASLPGHSSQNVLNKHNSGKNSQNVLGASGYGQNVLCSTFGAHSAGTHTLPHCFRAELTPSTSSRVSSASPSRLSSSSSAHLSAPTHHHTPARRVSSASSGMSAGTPAVGSRSPSPSPRGSPLNRSLYRHDY